MGAQLHPRRPRHPGRDDLAHLANRRDGERRAVHLAEPVVPLGLRALGAHGAPRHEEGRAAEELRARVQQLPRARELWERGGGPRHRVERLEALAQRRGRPALGLARGLAAVRRGGEAQQRRPERVAALGRVVGEHLGRVDVDWARALVDQARALRQRVGRARDAARAVRGRRREAAGGAHSEEREGQAEHGPRGGTRARGLEVE